MDTDAAPEAQPSNPGASPSDPWPPLPYIWTAVLGSVLVLALLRLVYDVRSVLVLFLFSTLFALVLVYPLNLLARFLPRSLAALIMAASVVGLVVLSALLFLPFVSDQVRWLIDRTPDALEQLGRILEGLSQGPLRLPSNWQQSVGREATKLASQMLPVAFDVVRAMGGMVAVIALAVYFAYDGVGAQRSLLRVIPPAREALTRDFLARAGTTLQRWIVGQLAAMSVTGVLIGLGLALLGIDSWLVLAVLSFVFEFVPYIGPLIAAIPGVVTGLAISPQMGLWVAMVYAAVQAAESYLLQPLIMKNALRIHPALQLLWQLAMAGAFGILGVFVATPLLAFVHVALEFFYIERRLGKPANGS